MKYVIILADGCADRPLEALGGKTPLEAANIPNMDHFAENGSLYFVKTVPDGLKPGSDVANLSVMGYDPHLYYTGRSPLEAASIGVELKDNQTAFRANTVTLSGEENYADKTMLDYSAGEITTAESTELLKAVEAGLGGGDIHFYPGVSYRHLFVWDDAPDSFKLTPPHDISDRKIADYLPDNPRILELMKASEKILANHPVNKKRVAEGKNPATSLWIWGEGKRPALSKFEDLYGVKGAVVSAVDLIKGIGILAGMKSIDVEGATGNIHTNFDGKAKAAADALLKDGCDLVYVHLEAPDECGHQGDAEGKARSLELIDEKVIGYIKARLDESGEDYKFMVLPDHPTPVSIKTHSGESIPCVMYKKGEGRATGNVYTEACAEKNGAVRTVGHELMKEFLEY
ncbi:MAG: cofactor-independent phosphoglycerate mutase [Oscillospiraceae bacterium]|nr:cofactor-independent phosphoglycerate mutase [Oscillospiraceae bacterium]